MQVDPVWPCRSAGMVVWLGAPSDVTLQLSNEARERSDLVDLLDQHWEERTRELRRRRREDHVEGEEGKEKER